MFRYIFNIIKIQKFNKLYDAYHFTYKFFFGSIWITNLCSRIDIIARKSIICIMYLII